MCFSRRPKIYIPEQKPPPPPPPAPPPPQPAASSPTVDDGYSTRKRNGRSGRRSLRIDLKGGHATSGGTGLNIPKG